MDEAKTNETDRLKALERQLAASREELKAARESETLLRTFRDSARDYAFITLDAQKRVIDWSTGAERLFGYAKNEILNETAYRFFTDEDIASEEAEREFVIAETEGSATDERWHKRKDGSFFWGSGVVSLLLDPDGNQKGFVKVCRDLTERKEFSDRLDASLRERDTLLREIHHQVKNNLQVITSLIGMQGRLISHPEMQPVFDELQGRVRAIAALHETLYSSIDLGSVLFGAYMQQLLREVFSFNGADPERISLTVDAADMVVSVDQALPLGLIVNELATNSLKHAFPPPATGEVSVTLQYVFNEQGEMPDNPECELTVSDNGVGLGARADVSRPTSMGLHIVNVLVRQLRGTINTGQQQQGTTVTVRFPLDSEIETAAAGVIAEIRPARPHAISR